MTLPAPSEPANCPICGETYFPERLMSTHAFGSPDLDLRPPPDEGRLLSYMVECCEHCGYACRSFDDVVPEGAVAAMATETWEAIGSRTGYPPLALTFKRAEWIYRYSQEPVEAIWMALRAIWVCDDTASALKSLLRLEAAALLEELNAAGGTFVSQDGGNEALLADLYRRSGQWETASNWADRGLSKASHPVVQAILRFQKDLIASHDTEVHQVAEAVPS